MANQLQYQLYCKQGELESLKYDYKMEYRKLDWLNKRIGMYLSNMKVSGGIVGLTLVIVLSLISVFLFGDIGIGMTITAIVWRAVAGVVVGLVVPLLLLLVVLPWSFTFLKNFRLYLKSSNGYGNHLYSLIRGRNDSQKRQETEEKIFHLSNQILKLEREIEQLSQEIGEPAESLYEEKQFLAQNETGVDYEYEEMKQKSANEIQSYIYHLENVERGLQKRYDREYSVGKMYENREGDKENDVRRALFLLICGVAGVLLSSVVKLFNLKFLDNEILKYAIPVFSVASVLFLVIPSGVIVAKKLILRYINSKKFVGKEYVDKLKEVSMSAGEVEHENNLTELGSKLHHIQMEKERLEKILAEKEKQSV